MKSRRILLALLLSVGLIGVANATTHKIDDLGALNDGAFGYIGNGFGSAGSFSDVASFTLNGASRLSGLVAAFGLDASFALQFGPTTIASGAFDTGQYSFADLSPGNYTLAIFGTNNAFGAYTASYSVAAVPEAETWLMIVIGLGLVAFQLQRRQRSLRQQTLATA